MKRALANSVISVDQFPRRHELGHGSLVAAMPLNGQCWECPKQLFKLVTQRQNSIIHGSQGLLDHSARFLKNYPRPRHRHHQL